MLTGEQGRDYLKTVTNANWLQERTAALKRQSSTHFQIADGLLALVQPERGLRWNHTAEEQNDAIAKLEQMTVAEREQFFTAFSPTLAPYIETAWQLMMRLPYQAGNYRRAFRAPTSEVLYRGRRIRLLTAVWSGLSMYDQPITWLAEYAAYLPMWDKDVIGLLLAAAIERGGATGDEVFQILLGSARGDHPIGAFGNHVIRAFLVANRSEGWDFIEKMALAAQREEGLRQSIFERADESHPEVFKRMVRLILEHDLVRFSSIIRAVDVWFGFWHESMSAGQVQRDLAQLLGYLEDVSLRAVAIQGDDYRGLYLALCAIGFEDAYAALTVATRLAQDTIVERRIVAYHFLGQLGLDEAQPLYIEGLSDNDLRVAMVALRGIQATWHDQDERLFEVLANLYQRVPATPKTFDPIIWSWYTLTADRAFVAGKLLNHLGERHPLEILPYLDNLDVWGRERVVKLLLNKKPWDAATRTTLLAFFSDRSDRVRGMVLNGFKEQSITQDDALIFEQLLTRKTAELRQGVISLLLAQPDTESLASAERLMEQKPELQRLAGLEILKQLRVAERLPQRCITVADAYRARKGELSNAERTLLDAVSVPAAVVVTLEDALGLAPAEARTRPTAPVAQRKWLGLVEAAPPVKSNAAAALLKSLDQLVAIHSTDPVELTWRTSPQELLLGNMGWSFPAPNWVKPLAEEMDHLPLPDVWCAWWEQRPAALRDADGLEAVRAIAALDSQVYYYAGREAPKWQTTLRQKLYVDVPELKYHIIVQRVLYWMVRLYSPQNVAPFLLDAVEYSLTQIPDELWREPMRREAFYGNNDFRDTNVAAGWLNAAFIWWRRVPEQWTRDQVARLWGLARYWDQPLAETARYRPNFDFVSAMFAQGIATSADMADYLLGTRGQSHRQTGFYDLRGQSSYKHLRELDADFPALAEVVRACRARIIDVESRRGDMPTVATNATYNIASVEGAATVLQLLQAMGNTSLSRSWRDSQSKGGVISHLLRVSIPLEGDTPDHFKKEVRAAKINTDRLIEFAVAAPQWAHYVEATIEWDGFAEAVWWILAHTKDRRWGVQAEVKELWVAQISERTPLTANELLEGAVDVPWFHRVYERLGAQRWKKVYDAAKYASSGTGHSRAKLFSDAMLERVTYDDLRQRAMSKRNQDALRAIGLLPLPEDDSRFETVLQRYKMVQEFRKGSRKFGAQRQAAEKLASEIALDNLARSAGYTDPIRLQWAMEAQAAADLKDGPLTATVGEVTVSLEVNAFGEAELTVTKKGKALKNVPPAVKKDPEVAAILSRRTEVKQQLARMRLSLEQAMVRGDAFTGAEVAELSQHPLLSALLEELIFIGDGIIGYPTEDGHGLIDHTGKIQPIGAQETLRVAHPYDLYQRGDWHLWQRDCFVAERSQPFKQVFRELYVLTETEKGEEFTSRRYEGHQVQPRQAMALLGGRGWVVHPYEGIFKTFHAENISVWLTTNSGVTTPLEMEGMTLDRVWFTAKGSYKAIPLDEIAPRMFSEVMRDLDLVVSVAHVGGVDPEASASTVEMRAALIRETCTLLGITNVSLTKAHALVDGDLNQYSVHLGSAIVHRQPGGSLCIVPVHSQHRGRLFLPFADDDPKSAEVLSKVLLLARDKEIKDPTILQQLLA